MSAFTLYKITHLTDSNSEFILKNNKNNAIILILHNKGSTGTRTQDIKLVFTAELNLLNNVTLDFLSGFITAEGSSELFSSAKTHSVIP